jgi:hypothetical protein
VLRTRESRVCEQIRMTLKTPLVSNHTMPKVRDRRPTWLGTYACNAIWFTDTLCWNYVIKAYSLNSVEDKFSDNLVCRARIIHDGSSDQLPTKNRNTKYTHKVAQLNFGRISWALPSFCYPYPTEVGTTCFHHVMIKIRHLLLRPAACLQPFSKLKWILTTVNAAGTRLTCLSKHGGAWDNKFWSSIQWPTSTNDA